MQNKNTAPAPADSQTAGQIAVSGASLDAAIVATQAENELLRVLIAQHDSRRKKALGAAA